MSAHSSNAYADAYVEGRISGEKFYRDERCDPKIARPNNRFAAMPLAAAEWERGFAEGYRKAQAERPARVGTRPTQARSRATRRKANWSLARLLTLGLLGGGSARAASRSSRAR